MRINVWGINFAPEPVGIAVYNTGLSDYLAASGHQVDVVTAFPYYPSWRKQSGDSCCIYRNDQVGRTNVHRCWHYVPSKPSAALRVIHEVTFVLSSALRQLLLPAPDVYVVVSPPLLLGILAWLISRIKNAPYHFHVQDLQPDAAVGLRMVRGKALIKALYMLEELAYAHAASVSGISAEICGSLARKGVKAEKIVFFPNWVELADPPALPPSGSFKATRALDPLVPIVSYAGNLGVKQGLNLIVEAATALKGRSRALFVIAGDGAERSRMESLVRERSLDNIRLEGVLTEEEHTALLIDSDLCLITQRPGSGEAFLPSKLLKTLALGRPVLTNAEPSSALARAVEEGRFGRVASGLEAKAFAASIVELLNDEVARRSMGEAGPEYVKQFAKHNVLPAFTDHLLRLAVRKR